MYERILVPLDGSKSAEQVFPYVSELAADFDSELILIGVCEAEESEQGHACQLYIFNEVEILQNILKGTGAKVTGEVITGKADTKILKYAEENDISIIIMASHGRSGVMPWSLGSTVQKVLHKVGVPLIIIRVKEDVPEPAPASLFRRILVPLDGSERGEKALPYVVELTKKFKSEVILLQVIESGKHVHSSRGLEYVPFKDRDIETMTIRAQEYLDEISSKLSRAEAVVKSEVRIGNSAQEIIELASEVEYNLIAIPSHGRSAIEAWIYGSVTYKILQSSDRSVLVVPSF